MDKDLLLQIEQLNSLLDNVVGREKLDDEILICECFCVNVSDIRKACAQQQAVDLDVLRTTFGMGEGCKTCVKKMDYWTNRIF